MSAYPIDVPPYQAQSLVANVIQSINRLSGPPVQVTCAQAFGSEIYVGCSNGELVRFALQATGGSTPESYTVLSQQGLPGNKPIDALVLMPSISRALVQSDHQIYFYTLPSLDPIPPQVMKPMRNVVAFAVDEQHLRRPPPSTSDPRQVADPVDFCVIKRNSILLYSIRERLAYKKDMAFQEGTTLARRSGRYVCAADKEYYNMADLDAASLFQLMPISQDPSVVVKPCITVISENEFLIFSWTGVSTLGVFITGDGLPVRGTLEWNSYPESVSLDYPYILALLPDRTIEIHNIETQSLVQSIPPPETPDVTADLKHLVWSANGFLVPSSQRSNKLRTTPVKLVRSRNKIAEQTTPKENEVSA